MDFFFFAHNYPKKWYLLIELMYKKLDNKFKRRIESIAKQLRYEGTGFRLSRFNREISIGEDKAKNKRYCFSKVGHSYFSCDINLTKVVLLLIANKVK